MKRAKRLTARQIELVSRMSGHRSCIEVFGEDGDLCEASTLKAVEGALELMGHGDDVIAGIRAMLGRKEGDYTDPKVVG